MVRRSLVRILRSVLLLRDAACLADYSYPRARRHCLPDSGIREPARLARRREEAGGLRKSEFIELYFHVRIT